MVSSLIKNLIAMNNHFADSAISPSNGISQAPTNFNSLDAALGCHAVDSKEPLLRPSFADFPCVGRVPNPDLRFSFDSVNQVGKLMDK